METAPFLVLTTWQLTLGEIDLFEMLEATGWGEYCAEPVIYERRHAKPGEESHLIDTRGGKGNRGTSGTHEANDVDEDASDICGICAEKEKRFRTINSKFDQ